MSVDKVSIVINNYFNDDCDMDTTIKQAYERGFRRCASKYDLLSMRTKELSEENAKLRKLLKNALTYIEYEGCGVECPETGHGATITSCDICNRYETESCAYVIAQSARELGIEVGE